MRLPLIRHFASAGALAAYATGLCAQSIPTPRTYSFTELNNMMTPNLTLKIYRDGSKELMDESQPVNADSPKGFHIRVLYDFQAHKSYTWDLIETARPCGVTSTDETAAPAVFDVVSAAADQAAGLAQAHPKTVGSETLNGIPATIIEMPDATGQGTARAWLAVKGGYLLKLVNVPKSGAPSVQVEVKELLFTSPPAAMLVVPAACANAPVTGTTTVGPPSGGAGGSTSSTQVSTTSTSALPPSFSPPAGFVVDEKLSKSFAFDHVQISYPKNGANIKIDPEGKTWQPFLRADPPNKTGDQTAAAIRASLTTQGWELMNTTGLVIARKNTNGVETWLSGSAFAGEFRGIFVEVGPPPYSVMLPAPAPTPEQVADGNDFPYLMSFPGSKLLRTVQETGRAFNAAMPGQPEMLVGQPLIGKLYQPSPTVSNYEFVAVYRDALAEAGWTIIRTAVGSDAQVIAHWAKNGRDIYVYLAQDNFSVADVGAQNEAKKLAADLARDGHVAIYGIYFDVDQSTLKPESETALQHMLELLKGDASLKLEVQGHTDNTGTPAHNQTLSEQRAATVRTWLVGHGVAADRLTAKGFGDTQPVGDNKSAEGRAKNRRVELKKG